MAKINNYWREKMKRFDIFLYDKNSWRIEKSKYAYQFVDVIRNITYIISGKIEGVIGINEDTFLILRHIASDEFQLKRVRLSCSERIDECTISFNTVTFLNDNAVIFDIGKSSTAVYLIEENKLSTIREVLFANSNSIDEDNMLLYFHIMQGENEFPSYIVIDYKHSSMVVNAYLQALIKAEDLTLIPKVYSSLRKQFVKLDDEVTLEKVIKEDILRVKEIEKRLCSDYRLSDDELLKNI